MRGEREEGGTVRVGDGQGAGGREALREGGTDGRTEGGRGGLYTVTSRREDMGSVTVKEDPSTDLNIHARTHARTHTRARAHTHTHTCNCLHYMGRSGSLSLSRARALSQW